MKYFVETDFSEWDLKKAFVTYLEKDEFATAKRREENPSAIKSKYNTQSSQASSSTTYTGSVVNSHSHIKNQNITINQERIVTSDSSDVVREAKRQKTSLSELSAASTTPTTPTPIENVNRDEIDSFFNPPPASTSSSNSNPDQFANRLALSAWRFRHDVYALGVKKLSNTFTVADKERLNEMVNIFIPTTLGEKLDMCSARMILSMNIDNAIEVNALKLSLSRTVNAINASVNSIFNKYIIDEQFWASVNRLSIAPPLGLTPDSKEFLRVLIESSKDESGAINFKQLRINVVTEKLSAINDDNVDLVKLLDIIDIVVKDLVIDVRAVQDNSESELTSYRKVATILDMLFKNSGINLLDGETTCKASKSIARNQENIYGDTIPLNRGFGRRIDLLLSSKGIELSTNEWKRKKTTHDILITQQTKNIRMNKAILTKLHELPIEERSLQNTYTMSMDWVGSKGYTFAVKKVDDIYIALSLKTISMPIYLFQLPEFVNTLDTLYSWSHHQVKLQEVVLPAAIAKEDEDLFSEVTANNIADEGNVLGSPNVYLTPTKSRKSN
ncbi:unnamed protein product [Mucor hiemalis]